MPTFRFLGPDGTNVFTLDKDWLSCLTTTSRPAASAQCHLLWSSFSGVGASRPVFLHYFQCKTGGLAPVPLQSRWHWASAVGSQAFHRDQVVSNRIIAQEFFTLNKPIFGNVIEQIVRPRKRVGQLFLKGFKHFTDDIGFIPLN